MGLKRSVLLALVLMAVSNLSFALLAAAGHSNLGMAGAIGFENIASGIGGVAVVAYFSALCDLRFTAAQYALISAAASIVGRFVTGTTAGGLIEEHGLCELLSADDRAGGAGDRAVLVDEPDRAGRCGDGDRGRSRRRRRAGGTAGLGDDRQAGIGKGGGQRSGGSYHPVGAADAEQVGKQKATGFGARLGERDGAQHGRFGGGQRGGSSRVRSRSARWRSRHNPPGRRGSASADAGTAPPKGAKIGLDHRRIVEAVRAEPAEGEQQQRALALAGSAAGNAQPSAEPTGCGAG